jgi:hypothetical protein
LEYLVDNKKFLLSYRELKEHYQQAIEYTDEQFKEHLPEILHLAIFISWLKENTQITCSDFGAVHELAHMLHLGDNNPTPLAEIRRVFKEQIQLA